MAKMKLSEELRKVEAAKEAAAIEREISLRRKQVEEQLQAKKRLEEEMRELKVRYDFVILFNYTCHLTTAIIAYVELEQLRAIAAPNTQAEKEPFRRSWVNADVPRQK